MKYLLFVVEAVDNEGLDANCRRGDKPRRIISHDGARKIEINISMYND